MSNLKGEVGGRVQRGRGKSQKLSLVPIASFYWMEEKVKSYGWPTLLPIINQVFVFFFFSEVG